MKTLCCGDNFIRIGRASYKCGKCDKDVSMEAILFFMMIEGIEDRKNEI